MIRHLIALTLITVFSSTLIAADNVMPPKNPKSQTAQPPAPNTTGEYGDAKFESKDAKAISTTAVDGDVVVKTIVSEVCPKKGCWMTVKGAKANENVRVTFKDYGFFVPTELTGKEVALHGRYVKHVESVEEQQHLMKDAKRPQAEIDAVTKPKETVRFIATGVKDLSVKPKN